MTPRTLLVFADDWGRHPSSCQHLMRQLLDRYRVVWVNTIGTRAPHFDLATLTRGLGKLRQWLRRAPPAGPQPDNPCVLNPKMWPWCRTALDRRINRALLCRQLARVVRSAPQPVVAVTTIPIIADLVGALPVSRWVYYCVDDFGQWPGLDSTALQRTEADLVRRADRLIAVSETLQRRLAGMGRTSHLLTHGVEVDLWQPRSAPPAPRFEGLERPLILFWGVVDRRMDVGTVQRLAAALAQGTVVLVGPAADPDPALLATRRVVHLGPVPFEELPRLAQEAAVLVMPYADLPVTRAIQPLKLKEYLATGRPVVVSDLPATRDWSDCADLAAEPESFVRAVILRVRTGTLDSQREARARRLAGESWTAKASAFETWAFAEEPSLETAACP